MRNSHCQITLASLLCGSLIRTVWKYFSANNLPSSMTLFVESLFWKRAIFFLSKYENCITNRGSCESKALENEDLDVVLSFKLEHFA